jgi:transcriptional regulator with XRE-family HTH domain
VTTAPLINQPTLGEMIEERRLSLGLTKSEAARLAGVSRGTWHEVETGKRKNMLADTLNLFDKALNYDRGTLNRASRQPKATAQATAYQAASFISHTHGDDDLELRMQLVRLAMTMTSEEVRRTLHLVDEFREWARAELSDRNEQRESSGDRRTERGERE